MACITFKLSLDTIDIYSFKQLILFIFRFGNKIFIIRTRMEKVTLSYALNNKTLPSWNTILFYFIELNILINFKCKKQA